MLFFVFDSIPNKYKIQEICNLAISLHFPFIVDCSDKCITQELCDEAVNDSLATLKLIPDWFVTSKMINPIQDRLFFRAVHGWRVQKDPPSLKSVTHILQ